LAFVYDAAVVLPKSPGSDDGDTSFHEAALLTRRRRAAEEKSLIIPPPQSLSPLHSQRRSSYLYPATRCVRPRPPAPSCPSPASPELYSVPRLAHRTADVLSAVRPSPDSIAAHSPAKRRGAASRPYLRSLPARHRPARRSRRSARRRTRPAHSPPDGRTRCRSAPLWTACASSTRPPPPAAASAASLNHPARCHRR